MRRGTPALAVVALFLACGGPRENEPSAPQVGPAAPLFPDAPVILVSVDTLRSDRLPAYGYDRIATPALDALAADSLLFEHAWSHVPLTLPSHLSLFTGRLPFEHGVRNNLGYRFDPRGHPTMAQLARDLGYATGGAVSSYVLRSETGVGSGFEQYDDGVAVRDGVAVGALQRPGSESLEVALRFIRAHREAPFLFFLHLFEPHAPWEPPEPFRSRYAHPYDGEVAVADALVGRLVEELRRLELYERCILILLSDHGEGLGDHGEEEHGVFLYREAIQVPLLLKLPSQELRGERIEENVQLIDLLPTLAELIGIAAPADLRGRSLLRAEAGSSMDESVRPIYAETFFPRIHLGWSELLSVIVGRHQFIEAPRPELYDLENDPAQRIDLEQTELPRARTLHALLRNFPSDLAPPAAIDPAEAERLAALGYLGSGGGRSDGPLPDPKDHIAELRDLRRAFALVAEGERSAAVELLTGILEDNPRFMDARNKLALTFDELGRYEEAIEVYRQGLELDRTLAGDYGLSMASIFRRLGRTEEARSHAELALAAHPGRARLLLGRIALDEGDLELADRQALAVGAEPPLGPAAKVLRARVAAARGDAGRALELLDTAAAEASAARLGPVESLELLRGDLLARLKRGAEAERAFLAEIDAFPTKAEPYARLAVLYRVAGDWEETHRILELMGRRIPTPPAYLLAARTLEALGDPEGAQRWRRRAGLED